ncbi:solute carrier family 51 subunit beta isoform X2 [Phyllopteryx taeniolatus]|uniref:solute carrier family 51 subunit beta isoform X2 n=1 Tax=Phyllopteryx taeniolatus TaxID=161469 RepID=UPI002AD2A20E|nr:solute carrier family 51 subunit beta isoform X2 [Phyllopteryx taeniolatus]
MFGGRVLLFVFLSGGGAFLVRHPYSDSCLEERRYATGRPVLRACRPSSEAQQWAWKGRGLLASVLTSRCLAAGQPRVTLPCREGAELQWMCDGDTLISSGSPTAPSVNWWRLAPGKHDTREGAAEEEEGNFCKHNKFTTVWKFVLLGLAFVCLLVGFLLLGMGAMASRNRRKIAKYKEAAAAAHKGEDRTWPGGDDGDDDCGARTPRMATPCNGDTGEMKAGSIVVTWKDGNTSCLYTDAPVEDGPEAEVELPQPSEDDDKEEEEEEEMKDGPDTSTRPTTTST